MDNQAKPEIKLRLLFPDGRVAIGTTRKFSPAAQSLSSFDTEKKQFDNTMEDFLEKIRKEVTEQYRKDNPGTTV